MIHSWQIDLLDKMTQYKGKGLVQMTGRQMGKSTFSGQAFQRLWDDINSRPIEELVLSEGRVHGARYYCVEPIGGNWREMEDWCISTYGAVGSVWALDPPSKRWYANDRRFWFRHESDRTMFILKWR